MNQLSDQEKNRIQTEKIFNTSERTLKEWISKFVKIPMDELFDTIPDVVEPVIFYPSELSDGKYIEMKLEVVPHDYSLNIDKLLQEKLVCDSIQFFIYSMRIVYGAIMKTTKPTAARDVNLDWDENTMTFKPRYIPDIKKKNDYLNYILSCMMNAKPNLPEEKKEEWEKDFKKLMDDIRENLKEMKEQKIDEQIESKTLEWSDVDRVGIVVRYITEEEIPDDFKFRGVKPISDQTYEDPPDDDEKSTTNRIDDLIEDVKEIILNNPELPEKNKEIVNESESDVGDPWDNPSDQSSSSQTTSE